MRTAILLLSLTSAACLPTTFRGDPKVPQGAAGCKSICASYGMELTGMIALGEYSDGCICELPGKRISAAAAVAGAASVAVMTDMRQREQQQRQPPAPSR
ncbi:MAG: hypothetical protein ACXWLR_04875 [Myxococcales bacterium]